MMQQNKDLNTTPHNKGAEKRGKNPSHIKRVAEICKCSVRYVNMVLDGQRDGNSELAENILSAYALLQDGESALITRIKQLIHF